MIKDIRYRPTKYTKKVISEELYNKWIQKYPEYSKYSFRQFCNFWKMIADQYKEIIATNTHGIRLPFYMGDMSLKYVTSTEVNRNWKNSNQIGEKVGHLNLITSGKNGKIIWSVDYARKFNSELPLMGFQSCRDLTNRAAISFRENPELFRISRMSRGNVEAILNKYHPNFFKNDNKTSDGNSL